jgi:hypothetical protein
MPRRCPAVPVAICLSLMGSMAIFPVSGEAAPPFYQTQPLPYQHYGYVPRSFWQRHAHPPSGYGSRFPAPSPAARRAANPWDTAPSAHILPPREQLTPAQRRATDPWPGRPYRSAPSAIRPHPRYGPVPGVPSDETTGGHAGNEPDTSSHPQLSIISMDAECGMARYTLLSDPRQSADGAPCIPAYCSFLSDDSEATGSAVHPSP